MSATIAPTAPADGATQPGALRAPVRGTRITAHDLTIVRPDGRPTLDHVSLSIAPGELVAVIGASGAGKTTLLDALAGVRPAPSGEVRLEADEGTPGAVGYVPQDDVVHHELPLGWMLLHAARLRLPHDRGDATARAAVARVLDVLGLGHRADVAVGSLSGGERKRASIAVELLVEPHVCFLDEPTSGLDPATSASLVETLRSLSDAGSTVVFTTHSIQDLSGVDRLVVLAPGGRLVWSGPADEVVDHFGVDSLEHLYRHLAALPAAEPDPVAPRSTARAARRSAPSTGPRPSAARQWWALTRRSGETLVRNRLTLSILLGSPALVIAMFAVLFRPGAFEPGTPDSTSAVMTAFWMAFAGFFFGLTYGLLQICTELGIVRREHRSGVRTGAYLLSKLALLVPFLLLIDAVMIGVLGALDRIPALSTGDRTILWATVALDAVAALCLGLLASALVNTAAQAALALPMLCFPAVLFAGAVAPVPAMTGAGRSIAAFMPDRWAFEAIADTLGVRGTIPAGGSSPFDSLGRSPTVTYWTVLTVFTVVLLAATRSVIGRRAAHQPR